MVARGTPIGKGNTAPFSLTQKAGRPGFLRDGIRRLLRVLPVVLALGLLGLVKLLEEELEKGLVQVVSFRLYVNLTIRHCYGFSQSRQ